MSRELLNYPLYPGDMVTYSCSTMRIGIIKKAIPYCIMGHHQEYKLSIEFVWGATSPLVGDVTSTLQLVSPHKTVVKLRPEEVLPRLNPLISAKFVELMDKYNAV